VADGNDIHYAHRFPCLKSDFEPIKIWSTPLNDAPQLVSKQNRCVYYESVRHIRHSDCPDCLRDYAVNTRVASQQPPPPPYNPLPERMEEDVLGEDDFSGYDSPRGGPSGYAGGSGGNLPPVVETLEAVETRVILTPAQIAILTAPFPIRGNS